MKVKEFDLRVLEDGEYNYPLKRDRGIVIFDFAIGENDEIELWLGDFNAQGAKLWKKELKMKTLLNKGKKCLD